jgi:hypothetical protein
MHLFLRTSFDLTKLHRIHSFLLLAGFARLPRSLHIQKLQRREIVVVERMDLHLVWSKARIFIKPLPDFLLNYEFWQSHIGQSEELHRAACGLLYSYFGLIRYDHDLWTAQEAHLINPNITFREWTDFVRVVFRNQGVGDTLSLDKRFYYGELHLERLHWIYRFSPQTISLSTIVDGYPQAAKEGYVPFIERYNNVVSAFGIIIVILTAMQVGLGTERLQSSQAFQRASFGFTAFAIIASACLTGFFFLMPIITLTAQMTVLWLRATAAK